MKEYSVAIPTTGVVYVTVEAENETEARQKALEMPLADEEHQWQSHEYIVRGNVFYGDTNEIEIEEIE